MAFFEHQDKVRKNTKVLVVYFVIAVACIIAPVYAASLLIFYGANAKQQQPGDRLPELVLWDPKLFLYVVPGTLGVVIIGSLYKTAALAVGGSAVGADGLIQEREAELLRAIADTLDCPIPPFVGIAET